MISSNYAYISVLVNCYHLLNQNKAKQNDSKNLKNDWNPVLIQVNLDMTDSMGPGKLVRHKQNPSYTYDEYLICIGLGPSISSVICKNPPYSGPSYPSLPTYAYSSES